MEAMAVFKHVCLQVMLMIQVLQPGVPCCSRRIDLYAELYS